MDEQTKQDIIRYLRELANDLESGNIQLLNFRREIGYTSFFNNDYIQKVPLNIHTVTIQFADNSQNAPG